MKLWLKLKLHRLRYKVWSWASALAFWVFYLRSNDEHGRRRWEVQIVVARWLNRFANLLWVEDWHFYKWEEEEYEAQVEKHYEQSMKSEPVPVYVPVEDAVNPYAGQYAPYSEVEPVNKDAAVAAGGFALGLRPKEVINEAGDTE